MVQTCFFSLSFAYRLTTRTLSKSSGDSSLKPLCNIFGAEESCKEKVAIEDDGEEEPILGDADVDQLCSQVLESVIARVGGRRGNPTLPVAALARHLPDEAAASELLHLATLDINPYEREVQAALGCSDVITALVASICGDSTPKAKQLSALALCEMHRKRPSNHQAIKSEIEESLTKCIKVGTTDMGCVALILDVLLQGRICQPQFAVDMLSSLSEGNPSDVELQCRVCSIMQSLIHAGAIDKALLHKRDAILLSTEWSALLARFLAAQPQCQKLQRQFHTDMQAMFHEEVVRQFEYEATERSLQLQHDNASGKSCLLDVIKCYVENLEDYQERLQSREFAWDASEQRLAPLDGARCDQISEEIRRRMEPSLLSALQAAADCSEPEGLLRKRSDHLRSECVTLLDLKTEATQEHQEQAAELRHETVLSQIVEYLESHATHANATQMNVTQINVALCMVNAIESTAPADAVLQLRTRLRLLLKAG